MAEDWRASIRRITAGFHGTLAMSERESRLMCAVELAGEAGELVNVVKKIIRGRGYYYLAYREKSRVRFLYKGRKMEEQEIAKYRDAKRFRVQYRKLLYNVRKQIIFLRKSLRAKQAV